MTLSSMQIKFCGVLQRMVQHALALEKGATYKDLKPEPVAEKKGDSFIAKITGFLRGT
jgi:hypothetical protein